MSYPKIYELTDFVASSGKVHCADLVDEIAAAPGITTALWSDCPIDINLESTPTHCCVAFDEQPSGTELATLDAVVAAHTG